MIFPETLLQDLRYAVRQFRHSPSFTISVMLTLVLAIGANSAIFSVVRAVLLQPLPYPEPDRLLCVWNADVQGAPWYTFSHPGFVLDRERLGPIADLAAYDDETVTVSGQGEPVRVEGGRVSSNFFPVLGVKPALGRNFLPEEDRHLATPVALLSDRFWRQRYSADPHMIGRSITIDGEDFTVIGVMPAAFHFQSAEVDVWRSRIIDTRTFSPASVQSGAGYLTVIARLHPGVPAAQFRAQLKVISTRDDSRPGNFTADLLQRRMFASVESTILVLWGAVACLLIIACANVANLVLARATARQRDLRIRLALGASRARIAQQSIVESVLLAGCSAVLSLPLGIAGMRYLIGALRRGSRVIPDAHLDWRILLFTMGIAASMGILFGLVPNCLLRVGPAAGLHSGGRGLSASKWSARWRGALVAAQFAMCLALLAAAGLLAQSFVHVYTVATGVRTDHVTLFPLDLMPDRYQTFDRRAAFYQDVLRRVEALPGVKAAGITSRVDLVSGGLAYVLRVPGNTNSAIEHAGTRGRSVSPDYFRVLGIPLLRGRVFDERDTTAAPRVAVVNEAFANKFFAGTDPIGRHVVYSTDQIDCEIVGVVANVRAGLQESGADDNLYLPLSQRPWLVARLLVRTEHPEAIAAAIRESVRAADPAQAVGQSEALDQVIADRLGQPRSTMLIVVAFAASALLLAAVGIYGVIAYSAAQRRKEIGIRMALGADAGRVRSLLFRQTFRIVAVGFLAGIPAAAMLSRLYASMLFDVQPGDPATFAAAIGLLIAVALAATYLPALRASKTDPLAELRAE